MESNDNLPSTKEIARQIGSLHYFTGLACKRGHLARRLTNSGHCTECLREQGNKNYHKHKEKHAAKRNEKARKRYHENIDVEREKKKISQRKSRKNNPGRDKERARLKREQNPTENRDRMRKWRKNNPEKAREANVKSARKMRSTPAGRINSNMSSGIRQSILRGAKAGRKWEMLVGYTVNDLMRHLEKQFLPGMTWENYGRGGWEIDHKIPLTAHHFSSPEDIDFKRAWALENLQPLWMADNRSKNAKLDKPFQPSLALAIPANDNTPATDVA